MLNLNNFDLESVKSKMTPELMSKLQACETPEALQDVASELGMDLSEEELTAANGGGNGFAPDVAPLYIPCMGNMPMHCAYQQDIKDMVTVIIKWLTD